MVEVSRDTSVATLQSFTSVEFWRGSQRLVCAAETKSRRRRPLKVTLRAKSPKMSRALGAHQPRPTLSKA